MGECLTLCECVCVGGCFWKWGGETFLFQQQFVVHAVAAEDCLVVHAECVCHMTITDHPGMVCIELQEEAALGAFISCKKKEEYLVIITQTLDTGSGTGSV